MTRILANVRRRRRCTRWLRDRRMVTVRAARCAGTHLDCPGCRRVQLPTTAILGDGRATGRTRYAAADSLFEVSRPRRRRARTPRRCH